MSLRVSTGVDRALSTGVDRAMSTGVDRAMSSGVDRAMSSGVNRAMSSGVNRAREMSSLDDTFDVHNDDVHDNHKTVERAIDIFNILRHEKQQNVTLVCFATSASVIKC